MSDRLPAGNYMKLKQEFATREEWNRYIENDDYCADDIFVLLDQLQQAQVELERFRGSYDRVREHLSDRVAGYNENLRFYGSYGKQ